MALNDSEINNIVNKVLQSFSDQPQKSNIISVIPKNTVNTVITESTEGLFDDVNTAVDTAFRHQKKLISCGVENRKKMIANIRIRLSEHIDELAELTVQETGMGRIEDKKKKIALAINKTPGMEDIIPEVFTGEHGMTLTERAPYGVILSITPSTNPAPTIINNTISMVAAGNAVIFAPHPAAQKVSQLAMKYCNQAIAEAGGPGNLLVSLKKPSIESANALMHHPRIRLVVVTGGPGVVKAAFGSGKKVIAAGPGNPPVLVDETADITHAAQSIVAGGTFDNNVLCTAEKNIIAVNQIADKLKKELLNAGMFELTGNQIPTVANAVVEAKDKVARKYIGRDIQVILKDILNIDVPQNIRGAIAEVDKSHPFVQEELLMPIIPFLRVPNVDTGIELAVEIEHGFHHTSLMHSKNIENLHKMAVAVDTSIFVKNGPSYAGLGIGGEGFTTLTISTPTGEGLTSARTFTRLRRCVLVDYFRIV